MKKSKRFNFYDALKKEFRKHKEFWLHVNPDRDEDEEFLVWSRLIASRLTMDELKSVIEKASRR